MSETAPAEYADEWFGYIVTHSGAVVNPQKPEPDMFRIEDIAHALSNLCRFAGHTSSFFSVSQHSVLVSRLVPREFALAGLLHDASEAYLSDVVRPVKRQPEFRAFYTPAETRVMCAIAQAFGFAWPLPSAVHDADEIVLRTEQRDLMPPILRLAGETLPDKIEPWSPDRAELAFLRRFYELLP